MLGDSLTWSLLVFALFYTYYRETKRGSITTAEAGAQIPFGRTVLLVFYIQYYKLTVYITHSDLTFFTGKYNTYTLFN